MSFAKHLCHLGHLNAVRKSQGKKSVYSGMMDFNKASIEFQYIKDIFNIPFFIVAVGHTQQDRILIENSASPPENSLWLYWNGRIYERYLSTILRPEKLLMNGGIVSKHQNSLWNVVQYLRPAGQRLSGWQGLTRQGVLSTKTGWRWRRTFVQ